MASQIPGYEYDVFISYRQNDNKTSPSIAHSGTASEDGWVSEFVANLAIELEATVKGRVSIYFDRNPHDGLLETHNVDESLTPKIHSLILVPIVSQTYCDPDSYAWKHEFIAFNKMTANDQFGPIVKLLNGNACNRVLPVRIHELDDSDVMMLEAELKGKLRPIDFIFKAPGVNRPLRALEQDPLKNSTKTFYRDQVNKTANAIKDIINGLKHFDGSHPKGEDRKAIPPILTKLDKRLTTTKSIAVLPFISDGSDANDFLGEGLAEDLLLHLSSLRDLKVMSRSQTFRYRGSHSKQRQDAKGLSVGNLVQGSVVKTPQWIWVTVKLLSSESTSASWSKEYKCNFGELPNLAQTLCLDIAEALKITVSEADRKRLGKKAAVDSQAYESFMKGRSYRYADELARSLECFQDALNREPQFARAYAACAEVYILTAYNGKSPVNEAVEQAKETALQALAIDPTLTEAFTVLAFISMCYEWSWPEVEPLFNKVFSINPSSPKSEERLRSILQQIKSSLAESGHEPINSMPYFLRAYTLIHSGRFDEALEAATDAVDRDPNSFMAHRALGLSHLGLENYADAIKSLEEAAALSNRHPWLLFELMGAYTQAGRKDEALAIMEETMSHANILPARIYNFLFP